MTSTHEGARTAVDDVGRAPAWGSGRWSAARVAVFLTPAVGLLALATALAGLLSTGGDGSTVVTNAWNERIVLHGQGLYRHDSAFVAGSSIGSDVTTLMFGLPLLVIAMVSTLRGSVRGRLLLLGTLGYLLYYGAGYALGAVATTSSSWSMSRCSRRACSRSWPPSLPSTRPRWSTSHAGRAGGSAGSCWPAAWSRWGSG